MRKLLATFFFLCSTFAFAQGYLNPPIYATGKILVQPSATVTTIIRNAVNPNNLNVFAAGAITNWTVVLPYPAFDGQLISIGCPGGDVTNLTVSAQSGDTVGTPLTTYCLKSNQGLITYQYNSGNWVPIYAPSTSLVVAAGLTSTGASPFVCGDGITMDYVTAIGRFSVCAADGFSWYTGGVGTTQLMTLSATGTLTLGVPSATSGIFTLASAGAAFTTSLQAGNPAASRTYTLPTNFGGANSLFTDVAGNGTTSWLTTGTGVFTALAANVTGSGGIVLGTSPTITSPILVTPTLGAAVGTSLVNTSGLTSTGVATAAFVDGIWIDYATPTGRFSTGPADGFGWYNGATLAANQLMALSSAGVLTATQFTSTIATGTAPLVVASTTNVANLNASSLNGATFAAPGSIGSTTPGSGAFSSITESPGAAWSAWTPTLSCSTGTLTTATASGRYRQSGKTLLFTVEVNISNAGSCSASVLFTLPNAVTANNVFYSPVIVYNRSSGVMGVGICVNGSNTVSNVKYDGTTLAGVVIFYSAGTCEVN